ncbi:MAG TPA: alpha/beta hydrolase fold domain-containing protein [Terriglobia bacterium]|nr:alpha/beta hydrolase fold domain-containing protein [Terriglobia bacterium]
MLLTATLAVVLSVGSGVCTPPRARGPEENFIQPGARSNLIYKQQQTLDAFAPPGEARPAAVIIHGSKGNKSTFVDQLFPLLRKAGYAWFSVDYGSEQDVRAALDYIRCPGRFNINSHTVLIGVDAGAAVALDLARHARVDGVVTLSARLPPGQQADIPRATKVLMIQGAGDKEVSPATIKDFCARIPQCSWFPVAGAIHDFENWHPDQWYWKEEFRAWLREDRRGLWKDIPYSRPGGRPLLMDAYVPTGEGPFPAVIIAHGGGWEAGDKITYVSPVFAPLARAGFAWFSIDYRLTPYFHIPDQLEDIRNAVRFVRQHAEWFHVDPNRIALLGESASGHLVAQLASMPCPGCKVQAVVSFYGVYNFERWKKEPDFERMFSRMFASPDDSTLREYSPLFHASANLPPMLIIQGTGDELYPGTEEYIRRLDQVHARHKVILLSKAPHGMENWEGHPEWTVYKKEMVGWLEKILAPGQP